VGQGKPRGDGTAKGKANSECKTVPLNAGKGNKKKNKGKEAGKPTGKSGGTEV